MGSAPILVIFWGLRPVEMLDKSQLLTKSGSIPEVSGGKLGSEGSIVLLNLVGNEMGHIDY